MSRIAVKPALQPELFVYSFPVRVYFESTDAGGVVYHAEYLKFFERARTEWLRHLGFDHQSLSRDLDDALAVSVRLESLGKVRCAFAQEIRREDEVLARAKVGVASLAAGGLKPAEMPEALRRKMEAAL